MKISVLKTFWVDCFTEPHSPLSCSVTDLYHIADIPGKARKKTCVHIEIKGERENESQRERENLSVMAAVSISSYRYCTSYPHTEGGPLRDHIGKGKLYVNIHDVKNMIPPPKHATLYP